MGKKIDQLDPYGSYDLDKLKADLIEISKNSGTSLSPIYAPDGSRQMRLDDLAAKLKLIAGYLAQNGLTLTGYTTELGGTLLHDTTIDLSAYSLTFKDGNLKIVKSSDVDVGISFYNNTSVFKGGIIFDKVRAITSFYGPNVSGYLHINPTLHGGIRINAPTAVLHIGGATGAAGDGPLKIDSAPLTTITEPGLVENDGNNLFYTNNAGVRTPIAGIKNDYSSLTDPNTSYDISNGWNKGSEIWTGSKLWKCVDNSSGAAIWILLYPQSGTPITPNNSMVNDNGDMLANDDGSIIIND